MLEQNPPSTSCDPHSPPASPWPLNVASLSMGTPYRLNRQYISIFVVVNTKSQILDIGEGVMRDEGRMVLDAERRRDVALINGRPAACPLQRRKSSLFMRNTI